MTPKHKQSHPRTDKRLMKVGEAARVLNTSTRTLRFYEEQGILTPRRTPKGVRLYSDDDIALVHVIQRLTDLGITLRDIVELATTRSRSETGDQASHKVFTLLEGLRQNMEQKKRECEFVLEQIDGAIQLVKQCFGCKNPPRYLECEKCPIVRNIDKPRLLHLIWDGDKPKTTP